MNKQCILTLSELNDVRQESDYEFLLGVSTDTLIVLNKDEKILERIIIGQDHMCFVCSCENEDNFLYCLHEIKKLILFGKNPLLLIKQ